MPLQHRSHPNWQVAVQGESNWRCRIKHKWHYLNEKKLRACERCGQLAGQRDYLQWIIDEPIMQKAAKNLVRNLAFYDTIRTLPPMPNPPPAPPPKRRPWHDREQAELMKVPPPPTPPTMKELRDGVIPKRPSGHVYDLESPLRPYGDGPKRKNWIGLFP